MNAIIIYLKCLISLLFLISNSVFALAPKNVNHNVIFEKQNQKFNEFKEITIKNGMNLAELERIIKTYTTKDGAHFKIEPFVYTPTGGVFESKTHLRELKKMQADVFAFFNERIKLDSNNPFGKVFYPYFAEKDDASEEPGLHSTLFSYGHYQRDPSKTDRNLPFKAFKTVINIAKKYPPITVLFEGFIIAPDGCILLKGFVDEETVFDLTEELDQKTNKRKDEEGYTPLRRYTLIINLGRLCQKINRESINDFYEYFSRDNEPSLGEITFQEIKLHDGTLIPLGKQKPSSPQSFAA